MPAPTDFDRAQRRYQQLLLSLDPDLPYVLDEADCLPRNSSELAIVMAADGSPGSFVCDALQRCNRSDDDVFDTIAAFVGLTERLVAKAAIANAVIKAVEDQAAETIFRDITALRDRHADGKSLAELERDYMVEPRGVSKS